MARIFQGPRYGKWWSGASFFSPLTLPSMLLTLTACPGQGGFETRPYGSVIPANHHDLSVTTEHESAAIESGATDASRPAGFIRACRLLLDGLRIPLQHETVVPRAPRRTRPGTDEPSAQPWHQISDGCCNEWALSGKRGSARRGTDWTPDRSPG